MPGYDIIQGANSYGRKTTKVIGGVEVPAFEKSSRHSDKRAIEAFDTEAAFLKLATERGAKGVPEFYSYENHTIAMEWVEGRQILETRYFVERSDREGDKFVLHYPEDLELQVKLPVSYVRTMGQIAEKTSHVKPRDNKPHDVFVVNERMAELGDLVIFDWEFVEPANYFTLNQFITEFADRFIMHPSREASSVAGDGKFPYFHVFNGYSSTLKKIDQVAREQRDDRSDNPWYEAELGRQGRDRDRAKEEIQSWLTSARDTPLRNLAQGMFDGRYGEDLEGFVKDMVIYYSWLDRLNPEFTPKDIARREQAFHDILTVGNFPPQTLESALGEYKIQPPPEIQHAPAIQQTEKPNEPDLPEELPEGYMSARDAVQRIKQDYQIHISVATVYRLISQGKLVRMIHEGRSYVDIKSLENFIEQNST